MSAVHSFDAEHASQFGIEEAIFINHMSFWIAKNRANGRHHYDGRSWTYNSVKALVDLFPYMTENKIRRTLESLVKQGVLIKGNFNETAYDRTTWFAFFDESIFLPCQIHLAKLPNRNGETAEPIPDVLPDNLPVNNTDTNNTAAGAGSSDSNAKPINAARLVALGVDKQVAKDFLSVRKAKRAPLTQTALDAIAREAEKAHITLPDAIKLCTERGWQGFNASWLMSKPAGAESAPRNYGQSGRLQ